MRIEQQQRPQLSQQQNALFLQSVSMLRMPYDEVVKTINYYLERNPFLEDKVEKGHAKMIPPLRDSTVSVQYTNKPFSNAIENTQLKKHSLRAHLAGQLQFLFLSPQLMQACHDLIYNLSDLGFHLVEPQEIVADTALRTQALAVIQNLDPKGVGVTSFRESLKVQVMDPFYSPITQKVVQDYWQYLEKKEYPKLKKELHINQEDWEVVWEEIQTLDPYPGLAYSEDSTIYIVPEAKISVVNDQLSIALRKLPELIINSTLMEMEKKIHEKQEREYFIKNLDQARWLLYTLGQRKKLLLRILLALVDKQRDFFYNHFNLLSPLTLKDLAQELGIAQSTLSRALSGKYLQTDQGIFSLRYFFSGAVSPYDGQEALSQQKVQRIIQAILAKKEIYLKEKKQKKIAVGSIKGRKNVYNRLTDMDIQQILQEKGISLSRRTVNKYRRQLQREEKS